MAGLKKGAKGKDVEKLQTLLNKTGAKLKVDGDFGPLTDKALRTFQKKAKLKPSGEADPVTMAALKYGGPLPEMKVADYEPRRKEFQKAWVYNQKNVTAAMAIQKEVKALNDHLTDKAKQADELFMLRQENWTEIADKSKALVLKQKEFEKNRLSDPKKAAKLASECEALDKEITKIGVDKIRPNTSKTGSVLSELTTGLKSSMDTIQKELDAAAKRKASY